MVAWNRRRRRATHGLPAGISLDVVLRSINPAKLLRRHGWIAPADAVPDLETPFQFNLLLSIRGRTGISIYPGFRLDEQAF